MTPPDRARVSPDRTRRARTISAPVPMPHDTEVERALLGGLLMEPGLLATVRAEVSPETFHRPQHRRFYQLLTELADAGGWDMTTAWAAAGDRGIEDYGGLSYLIALPMACPSTEGLELYAERLSDLAARRAASLALLWGLETLSDPTSDLPALVSEVDTRMRAARAAAIAEGPKPLDDGVRALLEDQCQRNERYREAQRTGRSGVYGVPFGLPDLDRVIGGLEPGNLCVVGARPAVGKTALALGIAADVSALGYPVDFYSYEMPRMELLRRLTCYESGVPQQGARTGDLSRGQMDAFDQAARDLAGQPLRVSDQRPSLSRLHGQIATSKRERGVALAVVDYIQRMPPPPSQGKPNREQEVSAIVRGLKEIALDTGVSILALSQLNRDGPKRTDPRPTMVDFRESGAIEMEADQLLGLHRASLYDDNAPADQGSVIVLKNRHAAGAGDEIHLSFRNGRFGPLRSR